MIRIIRISPLKLNNIRNKKYHENTNDYISFMYGSSTGQLPYIQTIQPSRSRYARLVQGSCFGERYPGIRYRQYGQSTLGEGFHRSSITSVDPLGSRKFARIARSLCAWDSRIIKSVLSRIFWISGLASRCLTFCVNALGTQPRLRSICQMETK